MQLFNVYQGGTLIFDIPTVTNIIGHAKVQGTSLIQFSIACLQRFVYMRRKSFSV